MEPTEPAVDNEQMVSTLRARGFTVTSPISPGLPGFRLSREDCEVFERYAQSVRWNSENVDPADQDIFKGLRDKLSDLAGWSSISSPFDVPVKSFTSLYQANGYSQSHIWCCIYPESVPNKSYGLQVALIVSASGAEICICLGAGKSQLKDPEKMSQAGKALRDMQARLASIPPAIIDALEKSLPSTAVYRRSWRQPVGAGDFNTLREWLAYSSGSDGPQASISVYLSVDDLESLGASVSNIYLEMARAAGPLFEYCYSDDRLTLPPADPRLGVRPSATRVVIAVPLRPPMVGARQWDNIVPCPGL